MSARVQCQTQESVRCEPGCPGCARVEDAALAIIGRDGSEALSHEGLELQAGLPPGEAARHYPTVEACLLRTCDRVCRELRAEFESAFSLGTSWGSSLALAHRRVLARLATHPAEASLCFVEPLRGDRELRRRRDRRRRAIVDFLTEQRLHFGRGAVMSKLQIELLVGAAFHEVATMVEAGRTAELPALAARFDRLTTLFEPSFGHPTLATSV